MARTSSKTNGVSYAMEIDSRTTSHMTAMATIVFNQSALIVAIILADDSKVTATHVGVHMVNSIRRKGPIDVSLSRTLVAAEIKTSILSFPALKMKHISFLIVPD